MKLGELCNPNSQSRLNTRENWAVSFLTSENWLDSVMRTNSDRGCAIVLGDYKRPVVIEWQLQLIYTL